MMQQAERVMLCCVLLFGSVRVRSTEPAALNKYPACQQRVCPLAGWSSPRVVVLSPFDARSASRVPMETLNWSQAKCYLFVMMGKLGQQLLCQTGILLLKKNAAQIERCLLLI